MHFIFQKESALRIVILCRDQNLYSVRRIAEAARRRRHRVQVLDPYRFLLKIVGARIGLEFEGKPFKGADIFVPRLGAGISDHSLALVRHLGASGELVINRHEALEVARDKLRTLQLLGRNGLPIPRSAFSPNPAYLSRALRAVGGPPVVFKLPRSSQGRGVMLADTEEEAQAIADAMWEVERDVIVQAFIPKMKGSDLRVLVVGGQPIAAVRRRARKGAFRSNLHRGGTVRRARMTREVSEFAVRAALLCGLDIAGVDLLETKDGPLVLEVNAAPGFESIERTGDRSVPMKIVDYFEERWRAWKSGAELREFAAPPGRAL